MTEALRIFTEHLPARRRGASLSAAEGAALKLVLPFDQRQKARQRVRLTEGYEVGIHLERGTVLRGGDRLRAADGTVLEIVAAREPVSTVWSRDLRQLAQVAYHLGNRHVALEVGTGWVRYLEDHVLDDMVRQLGLTVLHDHEPFEPEAGAYGNHSHSHGTDAPLAHDHPHGPHGHSHDEHRVIFGGVRRHGQDQ
jgi:urease accessory protein